MAIPIDMRFSRLLIAQSGPVRRDTPEHIRHNGLALVPSSAPLFRAALFSPTAAE
jgi:hypothetical protein